MIVSQVSTLILNSQKVHFAIKILKILQLQPPTQDLIIVQLIRLMYLSSMNLVRKKTGLVSTGTHSIVIYYE